MFYILASKRWLVGTIDLQNMFLPESKLWRIIRRDTINIILGDNLILRTLAKRLKASAIIVHRHCFKLWIGLGAFLRWLLSFWLRPFVFGSASFDQSRTDTRLAERDSRVESVLWSSAVLCRRNVCHTSSKITKKEMTLAETGWIELSRDSSRVPRHDMTKAKSREDEMNRMMGKSTQLKSGGLQSRCGSALP